MKWNNFMIQLHHNVKKLWWNYFLVNKIKKIKYLGFFLKRNFKGFSYTKQSALKFLVECQQDLDSAALMRHLYSHVNNYLVSSHGRHLFTTMGWWWGQLMTWQCKSSTLHAKPLFRLYHCVNYYYYYLPRFLFFHFYYYFVNQVFALWPKILRVSLNNSWR